MSSVGGGAPGVSRSLGVSRVFPLILSDKFEGFRPHRLGSFECYFWVLALSGQALGWL